jgi:hypothetical protein
VSEWVWVWRPQGVPTKEDGERMAALRAQREAEEAAEAEAEAEAEAAAAKAAAEADLLSSRGTTPAAKLSRLATPVMPSRLATLGSNATSSKGGDDEDAEEVCRFCCSSTRRSNAGKSNHDSHQLVVLMSQAMLTGGGRAGDVGADRDGGGQGGQAGRGGEGAEPNPAAHQGAVPRHGPEGS